MTLGEKSRRGDLRPSPALSSYTGAGHDGARGSGTRLDCCTTGGLFVRYYYWDFGQQAVPLYQYNVKQTQKISYQNQRNVGDRISECEYDDELRCYNR